MSRIFNTTGPCNPQDHYMVPAQSRLSNLKGLINAKQYFVIHAARQTGKTTLLLDLVEELDAGGTYYALYCDLQSVEGINEPERGIPAIVNRLAYHIARHPSLKRFNSFRQADLSDFPTVLQACLSDLCAEIGRPLVVLFDEVDCLADATLISFLRQLRSGYVERARIPFVHSVALVGVRNIRDYKVRIRGDRETLRTQSPFNITKRSLPLRNFTANETESLLLQHTADTGQEFASAVVESVFHHSQGQPWLVNAIAAEIVENLLEHDFSREILPEHVHQAIENIILRRETHIDSLLAKLEEPRVCRIVEPMILGELEDFDPMDPDVQFVLDLGLVRRRNGSLEPANPVYSEVIIRTLNLRDQYAIQQRGGAVGLSKYLQGHELEVTRLLTDFQAFWRQHSEIWPKRHQYQEAGPHLVLMAFLQNVLNGEGRSLREYASGRGRVDLCLEVLGRRYPIELKIRRGEKTVLEGCQQLADYMERMGCEEGWLVVFDRRTGVSWDDKLHHEVVPAEGRTIHVLGC